MSLGFDAISALPFATSGPDSDVNVSVTGNQVTISIGSAGVIADAVTEEADPNRLTLGLGTLSIRTDVDHTVSGSQVTLNTGNVEVNIDIEVLPSGVDLTLATGNVTITTDVNFTLDANALSLDTVEPGVITWNDIVPGATMVWTPIKPY
jgi:hypothetical protein